jgi:hypothetical protein
VLTLVLLAAASLPIPLEPGTWWEYRESYTERIGLIDSTEDDTTRFAVLGSAQAPFVHQSGGADPVSGPARWGDDWISVAPWTGEDQLPLPLEPGRSGPPPGPDLEGWAVEEREIVTVPAGTFEALRCALRTRRLHSVLWIVPNVGVVREQHGSPGRRPEIERVLLRWSGGGSADVVATDAVAAGAVAADAVAAGAVAADAVAADAVAAGAVAAGAVAADAESASPKEE